MPHYFLEPGPGNAIAFSEVPRAEPCATPAGASSSRTIQFDHVSFGLDDEAALVALQQRLVAFGCEVTPIVDHDILRSIYFHDPNGIALEASWWTVDGGGGASSDGGGYTLIGTSGQADAGVLMRGGDYTLASGFWGVGGLAGSPDVYPIYLPVVLKNG